MLIDWISAWIDFESAPHAHIELRSRIDRICRFSPSTGAVEWDVAAWDSVRSDSHQVMVRVGSDRLYIQGSPARCFGVGDAVMGDGPCSELDLRMSLRSMVEHVCKSLGVIIPRDVHLWHVTRVDVTQNLLLDSLDDVRACLAVLRNCEGGRYRVSQQAGDSVYWSHRSRVKSGKAYAKGPHLSYLMRRNDYDGCRYDDISILAANRLLRLELKLGREFFRAHAPCVWYEMTPAMLRKEWKNYFEKMLGEVTVMCDRDLIARCEEIASTPGRGRAAYALWLLIESQGWERARSITPRSSFYRHLQVLRAAGLGDADISAGKIVPFRRVITARACESWSELLAA